MRRHRQEVHAQRRGVQGDFGKGLDGVGMEECVGHQGAQCGDVEHPTRLVVDVHHRDERAWRVLRCHVIMNDSAVSVHANGRTGDAAARAILRWFEHRMVLHA